MMERSAIMTTMGDLKLFGMRAAYDEIVATAVKRQHEPQRVVSDLLTAELSEKQARSIKYQIAIARLPMAKDIDEFAFDGTPINETPRPRPRRRRLPRPAAQPRADRRHRHRQDPGIHSGAGFDATGKTQGALGFATGDRGSDPVPGMPGTGSRCRHEPGRFGLEDPERSEDRLVTVMQSARPDRADGASVTRLWRRPPEGSTATNDEPDCASGAWFRPSQRSLAMTQRTIGVDLAIRGEHVAQIFEDGRPVGRPLRFRHDPASLDSFVARATAGPRRG